MEIIADVKDGVIGEDCEGEEEREEGGLEVHMWAGYTWQMVLRWKSIH